MIYSLYTLDKIRKQAYFNYLHRSRMGFSGNKEEDWLSAERSVLQFEQMEKDKQEVERRKYEY